MTVELWTATTIENLGAI